MSVSTIASEIQYLNEQVDAAVLNKQTNKTILLSTCTETEFMNGISTITTQFISTIEGIHSQIANKKSEMAALKK